MKYIISENRMDRVITSVFDKDLTPVGGWWSHSKIKRELRGFEEAFPIYYDKDFYTDLADNDSTKFMNYLKKDEIVELEDQLYYKYESMFEDLWKPVFLKWFNQHSGLPIDRVQYGYY
jgi:hypothetical protein